MKLMPLPEAPRPARFRRPDLLVIQAALTVLALIGRVGSAAMVSFHPPDVGPVVSLDPRNLPDDTLRSARRMFIALGCSTAFSLLHGSWRPTTGGRRSCSLRAGDAEALWGRGGSGKSTLPWIMAGLIQPSEGQVLRQDQPLRRTNRNLAMMLRSFALHPGSPCGTTWSWCWRPAPAPPAARAGPEGDRHRGTGQV